MEFDTITAISTPLGEGAIAIVRISGDKAIEIANKIFRGPSGKGLLQVDSHTIHYGHLIDPKSGEIVEEVMIKHPGSGLHILAAPSRPEYAEKVSSGQFTKVLEYLRQLYAYVVVDTSTYLTDITLSAIDISDLIVLVTTQDIPAIKNCRLFLDLFHVDA